jgi:thiamine-monophosphate kinase
MKLKELGEFGLIGLFRKKFPAKGKRIVLGSGDDCAVLKSSRENLLLFTTDSLMEKVHFDLSYFSCEDAGIKAMAANISDIAAMGGLPLAAVVSLGLPKKMEVLDTLDLYSGMDKMAKRFGFSIVGGDIFLSDKIVISVALWGEVEPKFLKKRSGAKIGDLICVTGDLGESQAGLELLQSRAKHEASRRHLDDKKNKSMAGKAFNKKIFCKHLRPVPRLFESRELVRKLKINSMIDISDGLLGDLYHILEESKVGARLFEDKISVSKKVLKLSSLLKQKPLDYALYSGEEYELLFTVDRKDLMSLKTLKTKVSVIGEITNKALRMEMVDRNKKVRVLEKKGWVHF